MDDAQVNVKDTVKQHFKDGKLPRLDMSMLPRDPDRSLGTLRKTLASSFNYCKQYPKKLELLIAVLRWTTNYAMYFQAGDMKRREAAKEVKEVAVEKTIKKEVVTDGK